MVNILIDLITVTLSNSLNLVLLDRAEAGCRIHILAWDELDAAFQLASKEMKIHLEKLHPRIQVSRDPICIEISF
jgi:hypothetical protein